MCVYIADGCAVGAAVSALKETSCSNGEGCEYSAAVVSQAIATDGTITVQWEDSSTSTMDAFKVIDLAEKPCDRKYFVLLPFFVL